MYIWRMIRAEEVRQLINNSAGRGDSFLFGVDFELSRGFFIKQPLYRDDVLWRVGGVSNFNSFKKTPDVFKFSSHPIPFETYQQKFDLVHQGLLRGDSFLTNLTVRTPVEADLSLEMILKHCNSKYALMIPNRFVCFSPETFVTISNGIISSNPMKGTIRADIPDAEQVILSDYKETAEHYTIVDLIRNDLSRVASQVRVDRLRYIDRLDTSQGAILQVSSHISGKLPNDYCQRLGDILFELLPAGSVSGAPKPSTLHIIRRSEEEDRGYYCGVFGYFDGKNLDTAVLIRFLEHTDEGLFYRSGSGITVNSDARYEYEEIIQKVYLPFV